MALKRFLGRLTLIRAASSMLAGLTLVSCGPGTPPLEEGQPLYPIVDRVGGSVRFEFGPGVLETIDDRAWEGSQAVSYPALVDPSVGPVLLEIRGLDLSAIHYTGDMGWPPDSSDTGAMVHVELLGAVEVDFRVWSRLAEVVERWDGRRVSGDELADQRAYVTSAWIGEAGGIDEYQFRVESWRGGGEPDNNTIDLRLRYSDGQLWSWMRLRSSAAWAEGEAALGRPCPWNVTVNTAVPGTADSVWMGDCAAQEPGETGRARGAWIPMPRSPYPVSISEGLLQPRITIRNWEFARGPYAVSWDNVVLEGAPAASLAIVAGRGTLTPLGTAREAVLSPRGATARFSFLVYDGMNGPGGGVLRFQMPGMELTSHSADWAMVADHEVTFAGIARLNGRGGLRYEARAEVTGDSGQRRFTLRIWSRAGHEEFPLFLGFGDLTSGSITWLDPQ